MHSTLISGHERIFGNQQFFLIKELSDDTLTIFKPINLLLVEALEQLKTMGILDSTITLSQILEWTKTISGIKDHSHIPAETMNAYNAKYKKLCAI
jgi:hypothetical protein